MSMKAADQKKAARKFALEWADRGNEKQDSQTFWLTLLRDVFGVEEPQNFIQFENPVLIQHMSFIDAYIPASRVMIEQKSSGKDLRKGIRQSDGAILTPFQQAQRYIPNLPVELHPRYIITCNFQTFLIYDMLQPLAEPAEIRLADLEKEYYRLAFIAEGYEKAHIKREEELSIKAGEIVGKLYDALELQYANVLAGGDRKNLSPEVRQDLNKLCVRLVFCFYAEDAGVFGKKDMFHDYLAGFHVQNARDGLIKLFSVLDTPEADRDRLDTSPAIAFPYVNGGLFGNCKPKEVPPLTQDIIALILNDCCAQFDWSEISPTIFGAVFESTLNPETRRAGGMHYTSIENIHKVIDPLFLDELKNEFQSIASLATKSIRQQRLSVFQDKLASLRFLDPACGSGNFLTESYIALRRLENETIRLLSERRGREKKAGLLIAEIKVSIEQFYGIEINDFAVSVAKTALWIAESQMMNVTEEITGAQMNFLPLTTNANIVEGNALRLDWKELIPPEKVNYIMGNPPFVGYDFMSAEQKADMSAIFQDKTGRLDYVTAWYLKAARFIQGTKIKCALVSTNSITQGIQVPSLWSKYLLPMNIHIIFAHRTFQWDSEASIKAHVHVVIIGFCCDSSCGVRFIFDADSVQKATNISPYLIDGPNIIVEPHSDTLCQVPKLILGNMPKDGGGFVLSAQERNEVLQKEPTSEKWIRPYIGANEFIKNKERYCLWLVDANPAELNRSPFIKSRIEAVKKFREASKAPSTRNFALTPTLFAQIAQPESDYLMVPKTSSEKRRYLPIAFQSKNTIASDLVFIIPNAELYHFGILTSNVHMAWVRQVAGRLEMRYRYSSDVVYNSFPWPQPTPEQKTKIEQTAQAILDARTKYPDSSLADLYDDLTMPPELRKAHQENDKAVMTAYGFDWRTMTESDCVAELFKLYEKLVAASGEKK